MRLGAEVRARIPGIASGISRRKPASAADGFGTGTPWTTSYQDQMTSPRVQLAAAAAISAQAARRRPDDWRAAKARLIAATPDATASPMSATAIVVLEPPIRNAVQISNATANTNASNAANAT